MILKGSSNFGDSVIGQLLAKLRGVDEVGSMLSPVVSVLRFPDGGLLHVLGATHEPCFYFISELFGDKSPSLCPSPGRLSSFSPFLALKQSGTLIS